MGKMPLGEENAGERRRRLLLEGSDEFRDLFGGKSVEKALEKDNGLAEAGIHVVVRRIQESPFALGLERGGVLQIGGGDGEGLFQVFHEIEEGVEFMEELRTLAENDAAAETVKTGGAAAFGVLKILGIERIDAGNDVKVLGMGEHGAKEKLKLFS